MDELLSSATYVTAGPGAFASPAELEAALSAHGVDVSLWGSDSRKSSAQLLGELERGESILRFIAGTSVRRWVNVVKVRMRRQEESLLAAAEGRIDPYAELELIETSQILPNGRVRARGLPLSEKMLYREPPLEAARRGIAEELGLAAAGVGVSVVLDSASLTQWREQGESRSYPTLMSHYNLHQLDATVVGLPAGRFQTSEPEPGSGGRLRHIWEWRRPQSSRPDYRDLATVMWR